MSQVREEEEENDLPERAPSWMLFFEGTLYRRYLNYLNQHDFSQILNNKVSLDESFYGGKSFYTDFPPMTDVSDFPPNDLQEKTKDLEPPEILRITSTTSDKFLIESDRKRRARRTRCFICLGIFCIAAFAAAAALVIHFVFIKDKDPVMDGDVIRIGNGTLNGTDLAGNQSDILTNLTAHGSTDFVFTKLSGSEIKGNIEQELKLIETTNQPDNIVMSDKKFYIGDVEVTFSCTITKLKHWKTVFIIGDKIHDNETSVLNFNLSSDLKTKVIGKKDKITVATKLHDDQKEIQLMLIYKKIECEDEENFTCGLENEDGVVTRTAKLPVARKPESSVNMIVPDEVVSGKLLRISASWVAGYPQPLGNISWFNIKAGNSNPEHFENTKHFWTLKTDYKKCETIIGSFINFTPTIKENGTEVIAKAILKSDKRTRSDDESELNSDKIKSAVNTILVVPEDHCDGINNDTNIAHPYTCTKFVRCLINKMVVFSCPNETCFTEESNKCDYISSTTKPRSVIS